MPSLKAKSTVSDALVVLSTVTLTAFVIATLFLARDILIPLALSALVAFLLSPLVTRIERWIGRIAAVLLVVALIFGATGAAGWMLTRQLVDLATKLPEYKGNIAAKLHAFELPRGSVFKNLSATVDELKKELPGGSGASGVPLTQDAGQPNTMALAQPNAQPAVPVEVIETSHANPIELIRLIIAPLLGPLGSGALVLVLVICMLLQREDLRNRLIRLGELPEWVQSIWSGLSVVPDGGLSEELHASQNLGDPAHTKAPEVGLYKAMIDTNQTALAITGKKLVAEIPTDREFFRKIHRFYDDSFEDVCALAKTLVKTVVEKLERETIDFLLGPKLKELETKDKKLGSIKRLEAWLNAMGEDGRKITAPLVSINELRQGDAHAGTEKRAALPIVGILEEATEYQRMNIHIINRVAWALFQIAEVLQKKGAIK